MKRRRSNFVAVDVDMRGVRPAADGALANHLRLCVALANQITAVKRREAIHFQAWE